MGGEWKGREAGGCRRRSSGGTAASHVMVAATKAAGSGAIKI